MKYLKFLVILILAFLAIGYVALRVMSKEEPKGRSGPEADALAEAVMAKLNKEAFDTIPYLSWEFFRGGQRYFWDKTHNNALIEWDDNRVIMNLDNQSGQVYKDGIVQKDEVKAKLLQKAWSNWCNDSFWIIAPFKLFDSGTTREVVDLEDGNKGLKISYTSGGVTPGDVYLWELDENYRPTGWKMWTSIIPLKGMYSSWDGWEKHMGAWLSTKHTIAGKEVDMTKVKADGQWSGFGYTENPFKDL